MEVTTWIEAYSEIGIGFISGTYGPNSTLLGTPHYEGEGAQQCPLLPGAYARRFEPALMDAVWSSGEACDPEFLAAALSSFSPGWMDRHEEPVANPRFPDLRDSAVQDMLDVVVSRFSLTRNPQER